MILALCTSIEAGSTVFDPRRLAAPIQRTTKRSRRRREVDDRSGFDQRWAGRASPRLAGDMSEAPQILISCSHR